MLSSTLPIALNGTLPTWLTIPSQVSTQDAPNYTPSMFSSTLPGMLFSPLPIVLDGTLPACLTVRSQVSSEGALKHTSEHVPKYTLKWQDTPNLT